MTTPSPIVWDSSRTIGRYSPGGLVHYCTEQAQSLFISDGSVKSQLQDVPEGHWDIWDWSSAETVADYERIAIDHPANGTVYGVGVDGNRLYFLRWQYAEDIGNHLQDATWKTANDNGIAQFSATLDNWDEDKIFAENSIFQPGSKIEVRAAMGDNGDPVILGQINVDEISYEAKSDTVDISGRNNIGYFLSADTTPEWKMNGTRNTNIRAIISLWSSFKNVVVQANSDTFPYDLAKGTTVRSAIENIGADINWTMFETPSGQVVVGDRYFRNRYLQHGIYRFNWKHSTFSRTIKRNMDPAYKSVCVSGVDTNGEELNDVTVAIPHYSSWKRPGRKIKYIDAPDGLTQSQLQSYAQTEAQKLMCVGITQEFTGPFRPQLTIGDVIQIYDEESPLGSLAGLVTSVTHNMGRAGFTTTFTVDSGGMYSGSGSISYDASSNGLTREQTVTDLVNTAIDRKSTKATTGEETYKTSSDVPSWGTETVTKLVNAGYLHGEGGQQKLNITRSLLRALVVDDRAGLFELGDKIEDTYTQETIPVWGQAAMVKAYNAGIVDTVNISYTGLRVLVWLDRLGLFDEEES